MALAGILSHIKEKRIFLIPLVVITVILIARSILLKPPDKSISYTVKRESLVDTVQVSGTYKTALQKQVYSPTKGIITQLFVANNQEVKKGDPLFHVESTATQEDKAKAYADYQVAISNLKTAQQNKTAYDASMWSKQKTLLDAQQNVTYKNNKKDYTSPTKEKDYTQLEKESLDTALTQAQKDFAAAEQKYREADVAVGAASAQVTAAKLAYDITQSTTIIAPAAGTVVNLLKEVGDEVTGPPPPPGSSTSTESTQPSQPTLIIADFANPAIAATINESYASKINPGQKATIVFDALRGRTFTGFVQGVDVVGTNTDGIITYNGRVVATDLTTAVKPNMTAIITIEIMRRDNVIDVPNSALIEKDGKTYVKKAKTDKDNLIEVTVGTKGLTKTEITGGITEGEIIVANPGE